MSSCAFDEIKRKKNKQTKKTNTVQSCCNGFGLDTFSVKPMEERGHKEINYRNLIVCHICSKTRQTNRNRNRKNAIACIINAENSLKKDHHFHHHHHCILFVVVNETKTRVSLFSISKPISNQKKKKPKAKNKISSLYHQVILKNK